MVGQNIGKYRVLDRLGRGGMGTVYRALDETLHREVAIKVLNAELNDPEVAKRFRAEAVTVARLSHPGIATIYELFQHDGQWLMVMEFVRGETLEHLVDRMGPLSPQRAAEMCMQTLAALAHAHSMGVVHRDLKPANLMITETGAVKIMDFGIARVAGSEHLTSAGYMMGTPAYMAPEQVMGLEIDARADLYAVGVVFYRLATAKLPFKGETPFAMAQSQVNDPPTPVGFIRSDLPSWVEQVVVRALAKAPEERFQSAVEFHEAFARSLAGLPMTSLYSGSSPTEMLMTPARAMPAGTVSSRLQTPARMPSRRAVQPPAGEPAPAETPAATAPAATAKRSKLPLAIGLAVVAIALAASGGFMWLRLRSPRPPTGSEAAAPANTSPAPTVPAAEVIPSATPGQPPATPPGTTATGSPLTPAATATTTSGSGATLPAPTPGTGLTAGRGDPAAAGRGAPPIAGQTPQPAGLSSGAAAGITGITGEGRGLPTGVADTQVVFPNVKMLVVAGKKAQDRDALLSFVGGQISVLAREGGTIITSTPYKGVERATYVRARNPKWDPTLLSPPADLDMPGTIFRTARHWLVLQSGTTYLILRLDGNDWQKILETVESRTGIRIDRPKAG